MPAVSAQQSTCTTLASNLEFSHPSPQSAGFALGSLLLDADSVYWFDFDNVHGLTGGALKKVSKAGGFVSVLAGGLGAVNGFAIGETHLYWTEIDIATGNGSAKKVPKSGGTVTTLTEGIPTGSAFNVFFPGGPAVDSDFVYWGETAGGGAIRRVPKTGETAADLGRGQGIGPDSLAVDTDFIYGVEASGSGNAAGRAVRISKEGGNFEILASSLENAFSPVLDDGFLYWIELADPDGKASRVPIAGGAVTVLVAGLSSPHNIVVDKDFAYYPGRSGGGPTDPGVNGVFKVPKAGGTPEPIVNCGGQSTPIFVAVDETSAYFSDLNAGNIVKAAGAVNGAKLYFAHMGNGDGFTSDVVLPNPSATETASGNIAFFDNDGLPLPIGILSAGSGGAPLAAGVLPSLATSSVSFSIPPLDAVTISTDGQGNTVAGSAVVTSNTNLGGVIRFRTPGIAGVGVSLPVAGFVTPVRRKTEGINTAIAVLNTGNQNVTLNLSLRKGGQEVATATINDLAAGGHRARFINELFSGISTDDFEGSLVVEVTDGKVAAIALEQGKEPGQFTTLPVTPLE